MKKLITLALALLTITFAARADSIAITLTANVVSNLFTSGKIIDNITFTATSTNITTAKFFDSSNTSTTIVQAAYDNYAHYNTNITYVFTNEAGLLVTNNFIGVWVYPTTVSASTNTRPTLQTIVVPGSATRSKDVRILTLHGLNVVANQAGIVEVTYRNNP